jgi:hypothetical protein
LLAPPAGEEEGVMRGLWFACVVGGGLAILGCTRAGPKTYEVSGAVTFNGQPVSKGGITFLPSDKSHTPQGSTIEDGTYKLRAEAGSYRVQITATRTIPGKKVKGPSGETDAVEQYIPDNYNKQTTLNAEVKADKNQLDFPLTSR